MTALSITSQSSGEMHVRVPIPRLTYLKQIMRSDSFDALWPLFKMANDPCKEFTESYAAMHHLRAWQRTPITVLHIGDGAHARTAALFSFMTKHWNVSIDPVADEAIIGNWSRQYAVERLAWFRGRVEDYPLEQWGASGRRVLVTFVHAHVDVDAVLRRLGGSWVAAYTNACCEPGRQLGSGGIVREDWAILSPERRVKVLTPFDWTGNEQVPEAS